MKLLKILQEVGMKYPIKMEKQASVIEEVMRRGIEDPDIPEEKKDTWRYVLKNKAFPSIEYDANEEPRLKFKNKEIEKGVKDKVFNKKELTELKKTYGKYITTHNKRRFAKGKTDINRELKESDSRRRTFDEICRQLDARLTERGGKSSN